jgi:hypothetical protein
MSTHTLHINTQGVASHDLREKISKILIGSFIVLILSYVYVVGSITFNVAARKNISEEQKILSSHIGELEVQYLNLANQITLEKAKSYGFVETKDPIFVHSSPSMTRISSTSHDL